MFQNFNAISLPIKINFKFGGAHGIALYVKEDLFDKTDVNIENILSESVLWGSVNLKKYINSIFT